MNSSVQRPLATCAVAATLLVSASVSLAQDVTEAKLASSGLLELSRGGTAVGVAELNAHGPKWAHASQKSGEAKASNLEEGNGKRLTGLLPVPNTDGGAIRYVQTVKTLSQGFRLEYDITMTKTMKLNGLQFSLNLPVDRYAGKEVQISRAHDDMPELTALPEEQRGGRFRIWSGQGAKIEIAKETPDAVTLELRAATHVEVQDLRRWEQPVFEVRFPAIMEEAGREVSEGDRFHLDLNITFPAAAKLTGP